MFQQFNHRIYHYFLLILIWSAVSLPGLGTPALWDIDEGNNAEAALEMRESGNVLVPTFNYQLRVDKPALLYWLQMAAYSTCGVNEFAARLPSALAALAAVLLTYELGRRMFGSVAGLLAGLMLASALFFCAAARFANPDALLNAFTLLALFCFWRGFCRGGPLPFGTIGAVAGLGMLAKGPVGLVLPAAVGTLFLLWQRQLRRLADPHLFRGVLTFVLVAAPWYTWVGVETKGQWLKGFFWTHNIVRATETMENHGGPFFYYLLVLLVGFMPWSIFFASAAWNARNEAKESESEQMRNAVRFLLCWIAVYLVFFSAARTKLPNYILPIYPAIALLTARFLDRWQRGLVTLASGIMPVSMICLAAIGIGVAFGLLAAGGILPAGVPEHRQLPGLGEVAVLGILPIAGAVAGLACLRRQAHGVLVGIVAFSGVLFTASLAAWGPAVVDGYKAPRALAAALPVDQVLRDVRIGTYEYFKPSLVFYCHREVRHLADEEAVLELLHGPLPAFLFVPSAVWDNLRARTHGREVARHHDLYDGCEIVLVTNE